MEMKQAAEQWLGLVTSQRVLWRLNFVQDQKRKMEKESTHDLEQHNNTSTKRGSYFK